MNYTIYNSNTGQILRSVQVSDISLQVQDNESYVNGNIDSARFYISNGFAVEIPNQPNNYSVFDFSSKEWIDDEVLLVDEINGKRKKLLSESDWTQIPDVPLETKQAWATYRQALRDITTQESYPFNVIWPTKPD